MNNLDTRMSALENHFDIAFAAPNGIKKLRELILSLAMQGKLVPQDPNDQPASELLKEIETEKRRLVKTGKIRNPKPLPDIKHEEVPYELPLGWEWVKLGKITEVERGGSPRPINAYLTDDPDGLNWIKIGDTEKGAKYIVSTKEKIRKEGLSKTRMVYPGDFLLTNSMSFGRPYITTIEGCIHDGWLRIHPPVTLEKDFLYYLLSSSYIITLFKSLAAGAVVLNLNADKVRESAIPLPPLAEQKRIVAIIDQLMAHCDELEKLRAERQQKRFTVHISALNSLLEAKETDSFAAAWHFINRHFGELYSVKENVTELRKAILQLAVMGKLVPQDPNDQPASELLKEIEEEKMRLVKDGLYRNNVDEYSVGTCLFDLPANWEWSTVQQLGFVLGGKRLPKGHDYSELPTDYRYITVTNMKNGTVIDNEVKYISPETHALINKYVISKKDLYISIAGTIGAIGIIPDHCDGMNLTENASRFVFFKCDKAFLLNLLNSGVVQGQFAELTNKMAQPKLSLRSILSSAIPIPPLEEQHRIVAKIDKLMALCDQLEQQIDATAFKQSAILNAVMATT